MTAMTDVTENTKPETSTAAEEDETSVTETFENALQISQDVGLTECAASEETDSKEDLEQNRQRDRQVDRPPVCPPAAESCSSESKWGVGARCQAVWSEDGRLYPATVVSVDGGRCRVCFHGYNNEEEVEMSALRSPDAALQTPTQNIQDWKAGSRCRAVYSEDGLVYPAVVLWVKGQRCRIRFNDYNNEEEQDVSSLLNPDELHGPSRAAPAKGSNWRSSVSSSNSDWRRRRREESQAERGAERRSARRDDQHGSSCQVKEKLSNQSKVENEAEEKKRCAEKPTNHSFSFFPPFPPPPQSSSGDPVPFIPAPPPPPPLWTFGGKEPGGPAAVDATSSMLMLWYMCGFHTGSYLAQQEFKSSCKH